MTKVACALAVLLVATPAFAQIGGISGAVRRVDQAQKILDINMSEEEERQLGEQVSTALCDRFGVYQDKAVAKYVALLGGVLAQASTRPNLNWQFIVLDTDGVNAYATPGGFVHITRGALGLIRNEAELAGILGHEIVHVTEKHTIKSIQASKVKGLASDEAQAGGHGLTTAVIGQLAGLAYDVIFEGTWSRDQELESDRIGIELANKIGYSPMALADVLNRIAERNTGRKEPNGLFASHPQVKERVQKVGETVKRGKLTATATGEARYKQTITFEAKAIADVAMVPAEAMGLTGGGGGKSETAKPEEKKAEEKKPEEKKKMPFGLGGLTLSGGSQAQNSQQVASAGGKAVTPDRNAVGGTNKSKLTIPVTPAELAEFRKGIA
jgi:predicted Zn-dependent protease